MKLKTNVLCVKIYNKSIIMEVLYLDYIRNSVYPFFKTIQLSDIVDILIVAIIIYNIIKHFRKTRAAQLLKALSSISVRDSGRITSFSEVQPLNT